MKIHGQYDGHARVGEANYLHEHFQSLDWKFHYLSTYHDMRKIADMLFKKFSGSNGLLYWLTLWLSSALLLSILTGLILKKGLLAIPYCMGLNLLGVCFAGIETRKESELESDFRFRQFRTVLLWMILPFVLSWLGYLE